MPSWAWYQAEWHEPARWQWHGAAIPDRWWGFGDAQQRGGDAWWQHGGCQCQQQTPGQCKLQREGKSLTFEETKHRPMHKVLV